MWPGFTYSMPMPETLFDFPANYTDKRFLSQGNAKLVWCLWPRRCQVSRRWMWLTAAYRAQYIITGPGDPAVWTRWYSRTEMLVLKLKGY